MAETPLLNSLEVDQVTTGGGQLKVPRIHPNYSTT